MREPARGRRVGVPAAAAVPDTPEVSSELEELAAALRPAEDRLARRREDHRPVLARGVVP